MHLGRRAFLICAAMLSPFGTRRGIAQRAGSATPVSVDDFLRLSARLTGRSTLDPEIGAIYVKSLLTVPGNTPLLADLSRGGLTRAQMTPAHVALEEEILTAWYTGTYRANGTTHLATHTGALMWSAIGRPAPGTCVGPAGSWSRPPAAR